MGKNIYPCFKCGSWFETIGAQKAHARKCTGVKPIAVKAGEKKESSNVVKESAEFNREEAIVKLKEAEVIKDKRSVARKTDEELIDMLKAIEA